ncbi:AraC family transcriptional regulator [Halomonas sp. ANAO-440]|uniref:helix-turn-helix domain-containing protein n=1 Tax=Halomonas sp. ANAO-440 TaxID=2861360 RepID=UPI001CAA4F81|nr:helix-turn-helix domain-containing protein [Halomonas sp. ANAO-440]MBZ0331878.1 AraC family transcriptional regulator [Halomonas sp. ANAO-440]
MFNDMMRAEIWLQEHLSSHEGIDDLANRLGYSTSQVRRKFKQCFGVSPSAYRDILRLEKGARLLALTPYRVHTIALRSGYQNHSAFSRAFQRRYNQTPRQYRQAARVKLRSPMYCQAHSGAPPDFDIRSLPPRQALVTRLYDMSDASSLAKLYKWAQLTKGAETLPARLRQTPAIAVLHSTPLPCELDRIDIGPLIDEQASAGLAIPASFRILELPEQRHACLTVDRPEEIPPALQYLLSEGLAKKRCYASGDPVEVRLIEEGMEVRLPILVASS